MALVRNIVIVVVAIAFYNRFFRQRTIADRNRLLQNYDYVVGKQLTQHVFQFLVIRSVLPYWFADGFSPKILLIFEIGLRKVKLNLHEVRLS